jgi:hypothetical protein
LLVKRDVIEHVELRLGPEVRDVRDAAGPQMPLGLDRHVARVARVRLARDRIEHRAHQRHGRRLIERIHDRRRRIRQQQHVGLVDLLKAADRRPIEPDALGQRLLVEALECHPHVLPGPWQVGELQIDHARAVTLGQVEHIARLDGPPSDQRSDPQRFGHLAAHNICNRHVDLPVTPRWLRRLRRGRPRRRARACHGRRPPATSRASRDGSPGAASNIAAACSEPGEQFAEAVDLVRPTAGWRR